MRTLSLVYRRRLFSLALACGLWTANPASAADPIAVLTASNGGPNARLGVHVAADGDVIVVGASFWDGPAVGFAAFLPLGVRPAGWRLLAVIDPADDLGEANEGNNAIATAPF